MDELPPSLYEEVPWRGPGEEFPSLGMLEDTFGRSPDAGISLYGAPLLYGNPAWGVSYAGDSL